MDFTHSLNVFFEEITEENELQNLLIDIKNKYLNYFENKVLENEEETYSGNVENNTKEGYGVMLYKKGGIYIGEWKNNLKEGNGILFCFENTLKGKWKNNEFKSGEYIDFIGHHINGNFLDDKMLEVNCSFSYLDLFKFEGSLIGDYLYGKLEIKNGNIYEGKWKKTEYDISLETFSGKGEGKIIYLNGDIYKGKWENLKKNGKGKIHTKDGIIVESKWNDDILIENKKIILKFKNGNIFIGEIKKHEEDEDEDEDVKIESKIETDNHNYEEKLNYIEWYLSKVDSRLNDIKEYDEQIGKVEYDIKEIYKIWKIGQKLPTYIKDAQKLIFFKEFYKSFFNSNKNLKKKY